jgi:hypothetical protein
MTISRMQQPRQLYGLGSFVKSIGKGVKKAVKGVTGAVKDVVTSDLGKTALTAAALYYGGKHLFPNFKMPGLPDFSSMIPKSNIGKGIMAAGIGGLTGFLSGQGVSDEQIEEIKQNPEALDYHLRTYYKNLNPDATPMQIERFVSGNMKADGGRIMKAYGGDSAEDNAMQASGIMGLPLNENPAGITELDLRETGGFIPPVGVKEKADDIPAMLSNNEFVFTADAVRGMGDGNVNLGAQRMYDMMKKLENGGRV